MTARLNACLAAVGIVLAGATGALAQSPVLNPTTVEFDPSTDHSAVGGDGQPLVQRYELRMYLVGETSAQVTTDLGKPSPEGDGKIRVNFAALTAPWPPPDGTYEARVAAVGPNGAGQSDVSNQFSFAFQSACTFALSSSAAQLAAAGGSGSVGVTAGAGCGWTVSGAPAWLTLTATGGTGSGTVGFSAGPNATGGARSATLTIAGGSFTVSQPALSCTFALSPASIQVGSNGSSGSLTMTATAGCGWSATSSASWVVLGGASGTGSGTIAYTVTKNTTGAVREATIAAAGQTSTISQGVPNRPSKPKKPRVVNSTNQ